MDNAKFRMLEVPAFVAWLLVVIGAVGTVNAIDGLWHTASLQFQTANAEGVVRFYRNYGYIGVVMRVTELLLAVLSLYLGVGILWVKYRAKAESQRDIRQEKI